MACPDIVVVGASAGGLEAVTRLVRTLPPEFGAAVFLVIHRGPEGPSILPMLLAQETRLPIRVPTRPEPIRSGSTYLAPLDCHLLILDSTVQGSHGPRQHGFRSAVDPGLRARRIRELIEAMSDGADEAAGKTARRAPAAGRHANCAPESRRAPGGRRKRSRVGSD
jgi:chemotaxis response regulator CheB